MKHLLLVSILLLLMGAIFFVPSAGSEDRILIRLLHIGKNVELHNVGTQDILLIARVSGYPIQSAGALILKAGTKLVLPEVNATFVASAP